MKIHRPKIRSVKHRNPLAPHTRTLKNGPHKNRQDRRSGKRDWMDEWLDEINPPVSNNNPSEQEDRS